MADMTPQSAQRRRQLAQALMQNVMTPNQGQMVGRYYVGAGIGDGLAKLGQALLARKYNGEADQAELDAIAQQKAAKQKAMGDFLSALQPQQQTEMVPTGNMLDGRDSGSRSVLPMGSGPGAISMGAPTASYSYPETQTQTVTKQPGARDIGMALLQARNSGLEIDKDTANLLLGDNQPIEALGVVQQDQNGNVWNLNKRGQWSQAPFQAKAKTDYEPMRLSLEQKRLEAQLEQMRQSREQANTRDSRKYAAEDAAANAPLAAIDRIIEIASDKNGFYTGSVGDKAAYTSLGLGVGKTDGKFDNSRALDQLETSLLLASKPAGMGAMSDGEWEMLKKGVPVRANFPSANSYLSAVRNYRATLAAKIQAAKGAQQDAPQDNAGVDANSFFGQ